MSSYDEIPDELLEYVEVKINGYFVKKGSVDGVTTFGKFNSLKEACAAACILYKNNWKLSDVVGNPIVNYGGKFWVFKVEKNKLVLDNKFDDFESAVEFMEINSRCNDYHNDIFRNSIKKKGYQKSYESSNEVNNSPNDKNEYIFNVSGKFLLKKSKSGNSLCYGEFDSLDEAIVARKILLDFNWNVTNEYEISFYNNYYWVFEVSDGFLIFKAKFQSYEDALDIICQPSFKNESENIYIKSIDENFDKFQLFKQSKSKPHPTKSFKSKFRKIPDNKSFNKIKTKVNKSKVWKPSISTDLGIKHVKIIVKQQNKNSEKTFVLDFDIMGSNITCKVNDENIMWEKRYNHDFKKFPEMPLIIKIMEINRFDLSRLKYSSSIYYYSFSYYKIHLLDKNTLVFDKFDTYSDAENNSIEFNGIPLKRFDSRCPSDIDQVRGVYEMVKFHNGAVFQISIQKSLEEIKAVRDILILSNWNFKIFKKYDLFYLNGLYWEIAMFNNVIYLFDKYESVIFL